MVINNNVSALNTLNILNSNTKAAQDSLAKLSSGLKINKAADDPAGLAISQKMQAQITGLNTATDNSQDGISMIQTAEGSLSESQSILQSMNELAVQANNGTNSTTDTQRLQSEADQLAQDLSRISSQTSFNTNKVLSSASATGSLFSSAGISLQIGANAGETINITLACAAGTLTGVTANALGVASSVGTVTSTGGYALNIAASSAITTINSAINNISALRSKLGAYQDRLDHTINNLGVESQNLTSASSQITDVDMASEMTNFTKNNILVQSAEAMLAQANQLPQGVLSLLK
jgi:flagellin